jgi:hypothetical protein
LVMSVHVGAIWVCDTVRTYSDARAYLSS